MPHSLRTPAAARRAAATYARDGFYLAPNLFRADEMARYKRLARELVEQAAGEAGVKVWFYPDLPPAFLDLALDPRLVAILRALIGPDLEFLSAKPVFKSGAITFASPWHQDWAYWGGAAKVSIWLALDDATEANGCLKVIPGSHRRYVPHAHPVTNKFGNQLGDQTLAEASMLSVPMAAGGALFFHDLLLHASHENTARRDRWSFIPTYRNAAVPDSATTWTRSRLICGRSVNPTALPPAPTGAAKRG